MQDLGNGREHDIVAVLLAEVVRDLLDFVEARPADATDDDDVKALEDAAHVLNKVPDSDRSRLVALLGDRHSQEVGLIE